MKKKYSINNKNDKYSDAITEERVTNYGEKRCT